MDMNMRTESDRQRATNEFNKIADNYDKYRPNYPEDTIKTIINRTNLGTNSKLLEIGSGSGQATLQFAKLGYEMVCVEPGKDLIELGREKLKNYNKIEFVISKFEDYSEPYEYFDIIISAQAFHWVTQPLGYEKCSNTLRQGGYLAPFWNIDVYRDNDLDRDLVAILNKYNGFVSCMSEDDYEKRMESISLKIFSSGLFTKPEIIHSYWEKNYSAYEYFCYMLTGSYFAEKTEHEKQECFSELTKLADKYNGIKRLYTCELYLTKKI